MNFPQIDLTNIKGVLLDFDNTFYEYEPCHQEAIKAVYSVYKNIDEISYKDFLELYSSAQEKVKINNRDRGASHSRLLYFQNLLEKGEGKTNIEETLKLEELYWSSFIKRMKVKKEVIDFLTQCKKSGIKTCLITDLTAQVQFRKIKAIGVGTLLDFVVTSEEAGTEKPDAKIFTLALEKLELSPSEVIMIGDDNIKDIDGARKLGIKGYKV